MAWQRHRAGPRLIQPARGGERPPGRPLERGQRAGPDARLRRPEPPRGQRRLAPRGTRHPSWWRSAGGGRPAPSPPTPGARPGRPARPPPAGTAAAPAPPSAGACILELRGESRQAQRGIQPSPPLPPRRIARNVVGSRAGSRSVGSRQPATNRAASLFPPQGCGVAAAMPHQSTNRAGCSDPFALKHHPPRWR